MPQDSSPHAPSIILYGSAHCKKTAYYRSVLEERGTAYRFADVAADPRAVEELATLAGNADKFPAFSINGRKLRNPSLESLNKTLDTYAFAPSDVVHSKK